MNQSSEEDIMNVRAVLALCIANFVLPLNQFNIASIFTSMGQEFHQNVAGLGYASSLFFLGVVVSEIPGGLLASRYGAKRVLVLAVLLSSLSITMSGFSQSFGLVLFSRLVAGIGIGASFPPMVGFVVRSMRKGSAATGIGLVSLSFNLGGVAGLVGWAIIATAYGWRLSLFLGGTLGILCAVLLLISIHDKNGKDSAIVSLKAVYEILSIKRLNLLTIALVGISASATLVWSFMVYYLEGSLDVMPGIAGLIAGTGLGFAVVAPFVGRIYQKNRNARRWILFASMLVTIGVATAALGSVASSIVSMIFVGIGSSTGYTIALSAASELASPRVEFQSIAVGWMDSTSIVGGFVSPIIFSLVVLSKGYQIGWLAGCLFSLLLAIPLLVLWGKTEH